MSALGVTFWGVRGSFPAAGADFARYGGDTMCIEIVCGPVRAILDAGSGLRALGAKLNGETGPISAHIVLSHLHLDHVMGLAHFAPFWRKDARIRISAPRACGERDQVLSVLRPPLFPVDAGDLPAAIAVEMYNIGEALDLGAGVGLRTFALSHQGACAGMAIESGGRKLCYVTDHEHGDGLSDARVAGEVAGADLLIYDATYTEAEMPAHRGWGHSSWEAGVALKARAGVRRLALIHHEPVRTDAALDALSEQAAKTSPDVFFARQGMSLEL